MKRKQFIKCAGLILLAGALFGMSGCTTTIPTIEQITITGELIGRSSGMIVNAKELTTLQKHNIIEALNYVDAVIPEDGQTYSDAWTDAATKYAEDKKLDDKTKTIVNAAIKVAGAGVDYIFTKKYPDAKPYADIVNAAIEGFIYGFTAVVVPSTATPTKVHDIEAYQYLKSCAK